MLRFASISLAVTLISSMAGAGLITSEDDLVFGADSLTRDHMQGLDFLDVPLTTNRTINDISSNFVAGGDFEGFRYATEAEVISLINNYGFSPAAVAGTGVIGDTGADQLSGLVDLLGWTIIDDPGLVTGHRRIFGGTSTPFFFGRRMIILQDFLADNRDDVVASNSQVSLTFAAEHIGSFLVRETPPSSPVPEPASVLLFGGGLAGLGGVAMRRKRNMQPAA